MNDLVNPLVAAVTFVAAAFFWPAGGAATEPVVVELFTSQGCSSCPPADRLLGELARRDDVLPLSFHVTYWDRLGWGDTFGLELSDRRQAAYSASLGLRGLYTPQMVVGGRIDVLGSAGGRVRAAIELFETHGEPGPYLAITGDRLRIGSGDQGRAAIWLVGFDDHHDVAIERGENRGQTLRYHNVVREFTALGSWSGAAMELDLPIQRLAAEQRDGLAILVQRLSDGAIIAATRRWLRPS